MDNKLPGPSLREITPILIYQAFCTLQQSLCHGKTEQNDSEYFSFWFRRYSLKIGYHRGVPLVPESATRQLPFWKWFQLSEFVRFTFKTRYRSLGCVESLKNYELLESPASSEHSVQYQFSVFWRIKYSCNEVYIFPWNEGIYNNHSTTQILRIFNNQKKSSPRRNWMKWLENSTGLGWTAHQTQWIRRCSQK